MAEVVIRVGGFGPFKNSSDKGITCTKAPVLPEDVLRLADAGALAGFNQVAVDGQEPLVADGDGQVLIVVGGVGVVVTTDPATDTLTIGIVFGTGAGQACEGNDARLFDARNPLPHAASHAPGGADPVPFMITD